jgi:hypothetical protein
LIDGFHSNWTAPFFEVNKNEDYYIEDFEILTTMLSALKWRENNGRIKMITDKRGAEYYKKIGIESIWDLGIDDTLDYYIDKDVDPNIFWAAGKIYALKGEKVPCVMIDTDFIVWKNLKEKLLNMDICAIHKENISNEVYPDKSYFNMKKSYEFDEDWDWSVLPSNTALTYISSDEFKNYYVTSSIEFMRGVASSNDRLINMVFAEQRLFSICAEKMNKKSYEFMNLEGLTNGKQNYFTHIWGYKEVMRKDFKKRVQFCVKCIRRIIKDFPEYEGIIANVESLNQYYKIAKNN